MKAMIDGYAENGWQVFLLSMNTTRHYVEPAILGEIYKNITSFETVEVDNDVRPLPTLVNFLFSPEPNHADRFSHKGFRRKLVQVLQDFRPDVVQVESPYLSGYLADIRRSSKALTVLRMHNVEYQVWQRLADETTNPLKRFYLRNLAKRIKHYEERIWKKYDLLLPITHIDETMVKNTLNNAPTFTVPFGIDTARLQPPSVQEKWVAYHIGAMDWLPNREGIEWFINDVWPVVRKKTPEFEFYFAGRNMPEDLRNISIPGVHGEGEVPDAAEFIADKKILIVPIQSGGGIRVKILEAMAAGKIVVSTAVGMQGIEAKNGEHYIEVNTAGDFSDAISRCLTDTQWAEKIAEKGRLLIQSGYDAGRIAGNLSDALITRLQGPPS